VDFGTKIENKLKRKQGAAGSLFLLWNKTCRNPSDILPEKYGSRKELLILNSILKKLVPFIVFSLILSLAACARQQPVSQPSPSASPSAAVSSPAVLTEPSASPSPASPQNTSPAISPPTPADTGLTTADIKNYLVNAHQGSQVEIVGSTPVNDDVALVQYNVETSTNSFLLCSMKGGFIEELPVADAVLKKIVNENYFIFEDRGEFTDSAFRFFPTIVRCFRVATDNKTQNFMTVTEDESFDLTRSVQAGCAGKGGMVAALTPTVDGFEVLFKPVQTKEGKGLFYADATSIPPTKTSYDAKKNQFTVELETGVLADGIKSGDIIKTADNLYMPSYQIVQKGGKTYIVAQLNDFAKRYFIQEKIGPDAFVEDVDGSLPYLIVTFDKKLDLPLDY
jgi:hypothetical protein